MPPSTPILKECPARLQLSDHAAWRFWTRGLGNQISESEFKKSKASNKPGDREYWASIVVARVAMKGANWSTCRISRLKRSSRACWIVSLNPLALNDDDRGAPGLKAVFLTTDGYEHLPPDEREYTVVTFLRSGQAANGIQPRQSQNKRSGRIVRKKSGDRFHKIRIQKANRVTLQERTERRSGRKGRKLGQLRVSRNQNRGGAERILVADGKLRRKLDRRKRKGDAPEMDRDKKFDLKKLQNRKQDS